MLYQTLIGAWPLEGPGPSFTERMQAYALKAAREGKVETSWTNPDENYEAALAQFVGGILDTGRSGEFIDSFQQFAERTALLGTLNGLVQIVLKATMPGVPDFYQGTEFWDLSLVDPDNRRPVDFAARSRVLASLADTPDWTELASYWRDGRIKLALMRRLLTWRRARQSVFERGGYRPLAVTGRDRDHVIAFARTMRREVMIVVVGRHFAAHTEAGRRWPQPANWDATVRLDGLTSVCSLLHRQSPVTGDSVPVKALFDRLPVALLEAETPTTVIRRARGDVLAGLGRLVAARGRNRRWRQAVVGR
jgi:(1->4)-alpha-D-glucan 1-alpha-D-glucosylmutase